MKKLLLLLVVLPTVLFAAPVSKERANAIGENFFSKSIEVHRVAGKQAHFVLQQQSDMRKVRRNNGSKAAPYYIFNNEDGGFVIVAGDDCATPILGYSTEGCIEPNNLPIQLKELLNAYAEEIQQSVENNDQPTDSIQALWDAYNRAPQSQNATATVNALIATSWNQYPRYNNLCPSDASLSNLGGHPTTGCVATGMAQIMKYWEYPSQGTGCKSYKSQHYGTLSANFANTTYDWDNMPLQLTSSTSSTQNNAVATLMYHCGVGVSMNYNSDGYGSSGAYVAEVGYGASAELALKNYFGYASTVSGKFSSNMTASAWKSLLKSELDNQRPILYAGYNPNGGGHCFICDGYDSNDKFHFNWGWGGQANGFFSLTALTPSGHNYTEGQQAVIGIKPKDGSGPAKNYLLYMNTDLTATNTSSTGSSMDVNPYVYGKAMTFTAKVENNGTGTFNGSFRVAAYTYDGEFLAWSKESHHFSLGAGKVTERQTFTFDGGYPFIPGKYRAYLYYQDDDETEWKYVKTDHGVIFTEYNNVAFTVKITSGDLIPYSAFTSDEIYGSFIAGSKLRIYVDIRNTALLTTFYGKVRLNLYNTDGSRAQIIEERDFTSSGLSSSTTYSLDFFNYIEVEPGTYYMALVYQKKNETSWYYMRSIDSYPNFVKVDIKARPLVADEYEVNNTQAKATNLPWGKDEEMADFDTYMVSLHEDADIDYYKLSFPNSGKYKVAVTLYDKYNNQGQGYKNADAEYAYSIGGNTYSSYTKSDQVIAFNAPTTLYIRVRPYGMNGLGYYELAGDVAEVQQRNDCKSVPYTESFASSKGDFTVYNAVVPDGFTSIWNWDSQYGMVAKCIKGSTKYESESYLISPCIEIPMEGQTVLSFRHAAKFFQNTSQMTLWISTDFDASNPSAATWSQWPIPNYPPGTNWTWYDSGLIDVSGYKGQYINVAFRYTSTTSYAPQWEIKDFSVQPYLTPIENVTADQQPATKILRNGQILIQRGEKTYTLQGQEVIVP
ncbi:MAG: C10 family peptidase [Paludibacteraceae bacterium]|nr:C10 family peptidase [Paludibacteraceae bacterium]